MRELPGRGVEDPDVERLLRARIRRIGEADGDQRAVRLRDDLGESTEDARQLEARARAGCEVGEARAGRPGATSSAPSSMSTTSPCTGKICRAFRRTCPVRGSTQLLAVVHPHQDAGVAGPAQRAARRRTDCRAPGTSLSRHWLPGRCAAPRSRTSRPPERRCDRSPRRCTEPSRWMRLATWVVPARRDEGAVAARPPTQSPSGPAAFETGRTAVRVDVVDVRQAPRSRRGAGEWGPRARAPSAGAVARPSVRWRPAPVPG